MPEHILFSPGGASESTLAALLTELQTKLDQGGTVALDAPTLAALEQVTATIANLPTNYPDAATHTALANLLAAVQALPQVAQTDALTNTQLRAAPVPVNTGLTIPAPQTDALTNTQLRATPVPVSGTVTITDGSGPVTVDGTVAVSNLPTPQTDALTNAQLRASAVPVSLASGVQVSGSDAVAAGTLATQDATVELATGRDGSAFAVGIAGTWVGTISFERTAWTEAEWAAATGQPGNTRPWTKIALYKWGSPFVYKDYASTLGQVAEFHGNLSASEAVRVRFSTRTSGTVAVKLIDSPGTGTITVGAIAAGPNLIGATSDAFLFYCSSAGGFVGFNSTTDIFTLNNSTEQLVIALVNPAGSGKVLQVWRSVISANVAGRLRRYRTPTLTNTTPANERVIVNRGGGTTTPVGKVYRGGTAAGSTSITLPSGQQGRADHLAANTVSQINDALTVQVQPGQSLAFTYQPPAGGLGSVTPEVAAEFVWAEVNL